MKTWDEVTAQRRAKPGYAARVAKQRPRRCEVGEYQLAELRNLVEFTQQELALRMGTDQPRVSRVESETDMKLSTLKAYVEALGGEIRVYAEMPGQDPLPLSI